MPPLDPLTSIPQTLPDSCSVSRSPERLHISFNGNTKHLRDLRHAIEQFATDCGFLDSASGDIGLAVNEAVANIICHAYHPADKMPIELTALRTPAGITIDIRDWGNGEIPPHASVEHFAEPRSTDQIPEPGGLGLICMKRLMTEVKFEPQQPGMLLRMSRLLNSK